jgi:hypothetical protein
MLPYAKGNATFNTLYHNMIRSSSESTLLSQISFCRNYRMQFLKN